MRQACIQNSVTKGSSNKTDTQIIWKLVRCQKYAALILVSNDPESVFLNKVFKLQHRSLTNSILTQEKKFIGKADFIYFVS